MAQQSRLLCVRRIMGFITSGKHGVQPQLSSVRAEVSPLTKHQLGIHSWKGEPPPFLSGFGECFSQLSPWGAAVLGELWKEPGPPSHVETFTSVFPICQPGVQATKAAGGGGQVSEGSNLKGEDSCLCSCSPLPPVTPHPGANACLPHRAGGLGLQLGTSDVVFLSAMC